MREDQFRDQLRDALGDPPVLRSPVLRPQPRGRNLSGAMALLAAAVAVVLIVVLMASRIAFRQQGNVGPAAPTPTQVATPVAADSFPCALPVNVTVEIGDAIKGLVGFVNVPNGNFRVDPKATVSDLPHPSGFGPAFYSAKLKHWLPASRNSVSPDETEYAYVAVGAKAVTLHIVDATARTDRSVWTYGADMTLLGWDAHGILVMTVPFAGGIAIMWRVAPATGAVSRAPNERDPNFLPSSVQPLAGGQFSPMGRDGQGRAVFRLGTRDHGTPYKVVVVENGKLTATIYDGINGDARHFDPETASFDAHGIWLSDFEAKRLWLWSASSGLTSFPVVGLPTVPSNDRNANVSYAPAGVCVPGTFDGVAASPIGGT